MNHVFYDKQYIYRHHSRKSDLQRSFSINFILSDFCYQLNQRYV